MVIKFAFLLMNRIYFNDAYYLTDAVLNGTKTMKRVLVPEFVFSFKNVVYENNDLIIYYTNGQIKNVAQSAISPYKVGEQVFVIQPYKDLYGDEILYPNTASWKREIRKVSGWDNRAHAETKYMKHKIEILNVHIEKLQDISSEDCIKEGIIDLHTYVDRYAYIEDDKYVRFDSPIIAFSKFIDLISRNIKWKLNPYVFVYEFKLIC